MNRAIEERLRDSAQAAKDDIRGIFRHGPPEYRDYLVALMIEAAEEIDDLRQQIPAPPPDL